MPLTRGRVIGYDADRMMFKFMMFTTDAKMISYQVSSTAMDQIDGTRGTPPSEREEQFNRHRDAVENLASDIFDKDSAIQRLVVSVFEKHLAKRRRASGQPTAL